MEKTRLVEFYFHIRNSYILIRLAAYTKIRGSGILGCGTWAWAHPPLPLLLAVARASWVSFGQCRTAGCSAAIVVRICGERGGNYANRIMAVVTQHRATVGRRSVVTGWMRTGTVERN